MENEIKQAIEDDFLESITESDGVSTCRITDPFNAEVYCAFCGHKVSPVAVGDKKWIWLCECRIAQEDLEKTQKHKEELNEIKERMDAKKKFNRTYQIKTYKNLWKSHEKEREQSIEDLRKAVEDLI
jgi:hypothetical protein